MVFKYIAKFGKTPNIQMLSEFVAFLFPIQHQDDR